MGKSYKNKYYFLLIICIYLILAVLILGVHILEKNKWHKSDLKLEYKKGYYEGEYKAVKKILKMIEDEKL
jgi:hypothetical protein